MPKHHARTGYDWNVSVAVLIKVIERMAKLEQIVGVSATAIASQSILINEALCSIRPCSQCGRLATFENPETGEMLCDHDVARVLYDRGIDDDEEIDTRPWIEVKNASVTRQLSDHVDIMLAHEFVDNKGTKH
jgi:hypothetical protein